MRTRHQGGRDERERMAGLQRGIPDGDAATGGRLRSVADTEIEIVDVDLKTRTVHGVSFLHLTGELDIYTLPKLKHAIQKTLTDGRVFAVVNFLRTTYLDSTALSVLTSAQKQDARGRGQPWVSL